MFKLLVNKINDLREQIKKVQRDYSFLTEYIILTLLEFRYLNKSFYIQEYKIDYNTTIYLKENLVYKNDFKELFFDITELFSKYRAIKDIQCDFVDVVQKQLAKHLVNNLLTDIIEQSKYNLIEYFNSREYSLYLFNNVYNIIKLQNSDTYYLFSIEHQTDINSLDIIKTDIKEYI
jgi:hypothetical protein